MVKRARSSTRSVAASPTLAELTRRLQEAEDTLEAIRLGHVDALVVATGAGEQVFTLKGADRQYRQLVETMNEGALMLTTDGTIVYGNAPFARLVGVPLERLVGSTLETYSTPGCRELVVALLGAADDGLRRTEAELVHTDGTTRSVYLSATRGASEDDTLICVIATDLSDQHRDRDLLASERLAISMVEQAVEGIVVCDLTGRVIRASRAAQRIAGSNPLLRAFEESFDLRAVDGEHPGNSILARALRGEISSGRELVLVRRALEPLNLLLSAGPILGPDGAIVGCVVSFADVTERKRAAEERMQLLEGAQQARLDAEAANRAKDEFLAMLGHELRNPLAPIVTALDLMTARGETHVSRERAIIARHVKHVVRLVDDLLDVSRIAQGKVELELELVDLAHVVEKAIEVAMPAIEERGHRLVLDVPDGLPVHADETRLCQIISNLLTNAAKYTERGGTITVRATRDGAHHVLAVTDTGMGIAPELLPHLFDLFVQGRRTIERAEGGLGLGLAIVRSLTALHGGTVHAASDGIGHGTTMTLRLPVAGPASASATVTTRTLTPAVGVDWVRRILVVDDNVDAANLLADALGMLGYLTAIAYDGPSAIAVAAAFAPETCLLDIGLPGMDGYELAGRLRAAPEQGPVRLIALTGYGQASDRARAVSAGFDDHLVKPVDIGVLDRLLRQAS